MQTLRRESPASWAAISLTLVATESRDSRVSSAKAWTDPMRGRLGPVRVERSQVFVGNERWKNGEVWFPIAMARSASDRAGSLLLDVAGIARRYPSSQ